LGKAHPKITKRLLGPENTNKRVTQRGYLEGTTPVACGGQGKHNSGRKNTVNTWVDEEHG